jgi:DNA-binding CsgD family transcriptional regulator
VSKQGDLVSVVETAYGLDADDAAWVRSVTEASVPFLDRGKGVYAFVFDAHDPARFQVDLLVKLDDAQVLPDLVVQWHRMLSADLVKTMYWGSTPLAPISERLGLGASLADHPAMQRFCRQLGIVDQMTVRAADPSYRGVAICTPLGEHVKPSRNDARTWTRLAAHVAAGLRLRRALRANGDARTKTGAFDAISGADAILAPDGRCEHAASEAQSKSARESLREAVKRIDRARSKLRRKDPSEALETWRGLVDGRWSLVDTFDSDGRRYVVARGNSPDAPDPRALSAQERQVVGFAALGHANKEIAYALGIAASTVATHLTNAQRKLGASSRVDLVRAYRRLVEERSGENDAGRSDSTK